MVHFGLLTLRLCVRACVRIRAGCGRFTKQHVWEYIAALAVAIVGICPDTRTSGSPFVASTASSGQTAHYLKQNIISTTKHDGDAVYTSTKVIQRGGLAAGAVPGGRGGVRRL